MEYNIEEINQELKNGGLIISKTKKGIEIKERRHTEQETMVKIVVAFLIMIGFIIYSILVIKGVIWLNSLF